MRLITSTLNLNSRYKISSDVSKAQFHRHHGTQAAITHPPASAPLLVSHLHHRHRLTALNNNNSNRRRRRIVCLKSIHTNSSSGDNNPSSSSSSSSTSLSTFFAAFYKFTRPHTMLGTMISVLSISFLGIGASTTSTTTSSALLLLPSPSSSIHALWQALSSALLMNVCIVGINQIYDIEIDKINKPYLPLASGQMTVFTAVAIVLITGAASLGIGVVSGSGPLLVTLVGSLLLGIAYSVDIPLLRWKQYPVVAAACILAVRALLVQLGFFQHMVNAMRSGTSGGSSGGSEGGLLQWFINPLSYLIPTLSNSNITPTIYQAALSTPTIQFATGFMLIFSIVIALFKDIPDVRGDAKAGIQTLSVRWGTTNIYWACIILLEFVYGWAIVFGMLRGKVLASVAHAVLAAVLWWRGGKTDLDDKESIHDCYMDSWKLFYIEYLLLPLLN